MPGYYSYYAAYVGYNGCAFANGYYVNNNFNVVRPALHINLSSLKLVGTVVAGEDGIMYYDAEGKQTDGTVPTVAPTAAPTIRPEATATATPTKVPEKTSNSVTVEKPSKVKLYKVKNRKGKKLYVEWRSIASISGYQVQCALNKSLKKGKNASVQAVYGRNAKQLYSVPSS